MVINIGTYSYIHTSSWIILLVLLLLLLLCLQPRQGLVHFATPNPHSLYLLSLMQEDDADEGV